MTKLNRRVPLLESNGRKLVESKLDRPLDANYIARAYELESEDIDKTTLGKNLGKLSTILNRHHGDIGWNKVESEIKDMSLEKPQESDLIQEAKYIWEAI